jgi:uncharacterized protein (TIGR00245 family)
MNGPVGWTGLAVSLLLVAVAAGVSWWQHLGLQRQILISAARALAQLLLVGAALTLVIRPGQSIWWSWLWVAGMLGYAATVAHRRAREVPHLLTLALASFTAAAVVTLGVLFGLHVFTLTGRTLVPIAGMMVGNSMTATVLAGRRLTDELRDKRDEVEARLALGQASRQAATPYVRAPARGADPADRNHQGHRPGLPARGHDRPHPCRYRPAAGRPGPGRRHVPRPSRHRHHHRSSRPRPDPPPVHPRPPADLPARPRRPLKPPQSTAEALERLLSLPRRLWALVTWENKLSSSARRSQLADCGLLRHSHSTRMRPSGSPHSPGTVRGVAAGD